MISLYCLVKETRRCEWSPVSLFPNRHPATASAAARSAPRRPAPTLERLGKADAAEDGGSRSGQVHLRRRSGVALVEEHHRVIGAVGDVLDAEGEVEPEGVGQVASITDLGV